MKWYPVSIFGKLLVSLYVFGSILWLLSLYTEQDHSVLVFGYFFHGMIILSMVGCFVTHTKIFVMDSKPYNSRGFSLIELLLVIGIIGMIVSVVLPVVKTAREKAYVVRARKEFESIRTSLELYYQDYGYYPPDASRDIPPGLEAYLAPGIWPDAPWPDSVYDWENWTDPDTGTPIYQISIRFCPVGGSIDTCHFPDETWAANFGVDSAVYYCIEGACRSHINKPVDYPGYCINCPNN